MQVEYKITSIIPQKNQLELKDAHDKTWYYKLPHDQKAHDFKVGESINLERSETGPAHFLSVKSSLAGLKIGGSFVVNGDKTHIIKDLIKHLNKSWEEYRSENDWGSGDDRLSHHTMEKVEKEWYEEQCDKHGLNEAETSQVMDGLGY